MCVRSLRASMFFVASDIDLNDSLVSDVLFVNLV
jgi:hypothetical protein